MMPCTLSTTSPGRRVWPLINARPLVALTPLMRTVSDHARNAMLATGGPGVGTGVGVTTAEALAEAEAETEAVVGLGWVSGGRLRAAATCA